MNATKNKRPIQYRWAAPDGRRGRWRNSLSGALISGVSAYLSASGSGVKVSVDARIAEIFLADAMAKGWYFEHQRKVSR